MVLASSFIWLSVLQSETSRGTGVNWERRARLVLMQKSNERQGCCCVELLDRVDSCRDKIFPGLLTDRRRKNKL